MRKLAFPNDVLFQSAHEGFLAAARGTTRDEHRLIDKILTKLEDASMAGDTVVPGYDPSSEAAPRRRFLDTTRASVILEDTEYNFFKKQIDSLQGPALMSRAITKLQDFVDAAPAVDVKAVSKAE